MSSGGVSEKILKKSMLLALLRTSRLATKVASTFYKTKYDFIEIDITHDCNLKCFNCNRSCRQAPSTDSMSVEQIEKFIKESIKQNRQWKGIRLVGGEPTMHKDVLKIAERIQNYKIFSPNIMVRFATNGGSVISNKILEKLPKDFIVENTNKKTIIQDFIPFNIAPIDDWKFRLTDFSNACPITELCGLGLTKNGYYQCAVAGSIDRVVGLNMGRKILPEIRDPMIFEKRELCKYCGHFRELFGADKVEKEIITKSWANAYNKYLEEPSKLTEY